MLDISPPALASGHLSSKLEAPHLTHCWDWRLPEVQICNLDEFGPYRETEQHDQHEPRFVLGGISEGMPSQEPWAIPGRSPPSRGWTFVAVWVFHRAPTPPRPAWPKSSVELRSRLTCLKSHLLRQTNSRPKKRPSPQRFHQDAEIATGTTRRNANMEPVEQSEQEANMATFFPRPSSWQD